MNPMENHARFNLNHNFSNKIIGATTAMRTKLLHLDKCNENLQLTDRLPWFRLEFKSFFRKKTNTTFSAFLFLGAVEIQLQNKPEFKLVISHELPSLDRFALYLNTDQISPGAPIHLYKWAFTLLIIAGFHYTVECLLQSPVCFS